MIIIPGSRPIYWECKEDEHSKFWAAQIVESKENSTTEYILTRKWGAIGTEGQRMEQSYSNRLEAERALDKLIWNKESKGYKAIF